jgi:hypothetical protein
MSQYLHAMEKLFRLETDDGNPPQPQELSDVTDPAATDEPE